MATHTVSNNRKTRWDIDKNNDTWIVEKNASIRTADFTGIHEEDQFSGNTIRILGDVTVLGPGNGVLTNGTGTQIVVGKQATVTAINAILTYGSDEKVINNGELYGAVTGVLATGDGLRLNNNGLIFGTLGVEVYADDARLVNGANGVIAAEHGISTYSDSRVDIVNKGVISAVMAIAIFDGDTEPGSAHVINTGKIYGDVYLGDGDDIFDTLKGEAVTTIRGGDGDDEILLADSDIGIIEHAGEGNDTVKSKASYVLFDHVENLTLLGAANIDGSGNDGGNVLIGNKGRNKLEGLDRIDVLNGREGNDTLDGSDDNVVDLYVFDRGTGKDVIAIFEDGVDIISLANYDGIDGFEDIDVAQDGLDTVVTLLGGDRVRIKNFTATNLADADFAFEIF